MFAIDAGDASTLSVTIPPTGAYYIDSVEVIDIVVQASATFNQRRVYVTNFTIQGASLLERQHHAYLQTLTDLRSVVLALRRSENPGPRPPSETFELRVVEASDAVRASALSSFHAPLDVAAIADAGGLDELVRRSRLDDSSSASSSSSSYGDVD